MPLSFSVSIPNLTATAALSALLLQPLTCNAVVDPPVSTEVQPSQQARLPEQQHPLKRYTHSHPDVLLDTEHAFADEIWQLVNRYYVDPDFNHTDWSAARQQLFHMPLTSRTDTYRAVRLMLRKLSDRYTRVLTPNQMRLLRKFDVSGVGLLLTTDAKGDLVVATDPAADTAAGKAGIMRGDVLLQIGGVDVTTVGAFGASQMMQGKNGTEVSMKFRDRGEVSLMRTFSGGKAVTWHTTQTEEGTMGYVRLKEFRASAREEVEQALQSVLAEGAEWIELDLRGNGGGVFEGALEIAGMMEGGGKPVAIVKGRTDAMGQDVPLGEEVYRSRVIGEKVLKDGVEIAIIVDGGSASSSEVLAGGLRGTCRATLVGEKTFGKGLIQGVFGLSDGGGVVITVAEYRTPTGGGIQGVGLTPDLKVKKGAFEMLLKIMGVEKIGAVDVSRQQVREALMNCVPGDAV